MEYNINCKILTYSFNQHIGDEETVDRLIKCGTYLEPVDVAHKTPLLLSIEQSIYIDHLK